MSSITRFNRRTSGRNLSEVRRPVIAVPKKAEPKAKALTKARKPESNDADVAVSDG